MVRWIALAVALSAAQVVASEPLRVGVAGEPPFVKWNEPGPPLGAAVEIWEKIAAANTWTFSYQPFPSVDTGLAAVAAGEIDVLVGNTGITRARLAEVEFSQPFFRSGLQIMIPEARPHSVGRIWSDLAEITRLEVFWYVVGAVVLLTVAVFLFERRHNPEFPKTRREGMAESFYYVVSLALTGKSVYKGFPGVLGRLVMVVWTILGLLTVAYVTSSITSAMTVEKLTAKISGPQDLPGKTVAAVTGSSGADYLREKEVTTLLVADLDAAVAAILGGKAAAIVDDAPVLQMYDFEHPQLPITEVGPIFLTQNYGFALAIGSPLRLHVNSALLELVESQALSDILQHHMGDLQPH